jgi:predicted extracellular nuclease
MNIVARRLALAGVLCAGLGTAHAQVVISQVWGSAGSPGAVYDRDYVELFNRGSSAVSLNGLSVQYQGASANGRYTVLGALPNISLQPGQRFLVGLASGAGASALPAPDLSNTTDIATAGKLVLATGTTGLICAHGPGSVKCDVSEPARIVDMVGYGSNANDYEGSAPAPTPTATSAIQRLNNGATDTNQNGADFALGTPSPRNSGAMWTPTDGTPVIAITNASVGEGNGGTTPLFFSISLSAPAGVGGVSFDWATADATASAGSDYVAASGSATIPEGATSVIVSVDVSGDWDLEGDETFAVNLSNLTGALPYDVQGVGTITNDDVAITAIHDIQGNGAASPLAGQAVNTRGIVTGRKSNGFFVQAADADCDADPATSEGIFVFTGSAPSVAAAVGNFVQVSGTVAEFVPAADPLQAPMTELTSPSVLAISTGNPLPSAMMLDATFPAPTGAVDQLERYEGMRVTASSFTVVAPTRGSVNQANATGGSNGIFNVVVTGNERPFREAGIQMPDPDPVGSIAAAIPRWDFNPELLTVDSDAIGAPQLNLATGATITGLTGPLDFGFRRYTILAEAGAVASGGQLPEGVRAPTEDEFTVASYNLQRFFDTSDDPATSDAIPTAAAFDKRLAKASLAIRDYLHAPDVVGVQEVENLATLQAIAARVSADAVAAYQADPQYSAILLEGNDIGGIDVGLLVKTAGEYAPRVEVLSVEQLGKDTTWTDPSDGAEHLLNDRPPLLAKLVVHYADGREVPLTVVVVHQRSLDGVNSEDADGATTEGDRVRQKRQRQAEFLAGEIQARQAADADEHIVVLGDFNAFEFNDGYADALNVVAGTPSADDATAVTGDGADLVNPDLANLRSFGGANDYSYVFEGNAQSLDHMLANEALLGDVGAVELAHAHFNADFPEILRGDATTPSRLSDHDPMVAYFAVDRADLSMDATGPAAAVLPGSALAFQAVVANAGPSAAQFPGVGFAFDAELADLAVTAPAGWTCDEPTIAYGTSVLSCSASALASGGDATFAFSATAPKAKSGQAITLVASVDSTTFDPESANDSDSTAANVTEVADLAIALMSRTRGASTTTYEFVADNDGPVGATGVAVDITSDLKAGIGSIVAPEGWVCTPKTGMLGAICTAATFASGTDATFTMTVPSKLDKTQYRVVGTVQSDTVDMVTANNRCAHRLAMPGL